MIGDKILELKQVSLVRVKDLLVKRKKEKELTYEQDVTLKYAKMFGKITRIQAKKLGNELSKIEGLPKEMAIKIIDVLPKDKEHLELIYPKNFKLEDSVIEKVLDLTKKITPKEPKEAKTAKKK